MSVIRWEAPADAPSVPRPSPRKATKWEAIGEELRGKPGQWAVVAEFEPTPGWSTDRDRSRARGTARNINVGLYKGTADMQAVAQFRDGAWCVYARYTGWDRP